jgi:nicotinamide-nucleotide amidase
MAVLATGPAGQDQPGLTLPDPLAVLAGRTLAACAGARLTLATGESCTGGLVAHLLTEVPGSSVVVRGAIVAYADDVKREVLGVPAEVLATHGAVSAQVALAMAAGVRRRLGSDVGVSVTGIAGPDGGTPEKPVGLVYIAIVTPDGTEVERHHWPGDRSANKRDSAQAALELVLRHATRPERAASRDAQPGAAPGPDLGPDLGPDPDTGPAFATQPAADER